MKTIKLPTEQFQLIQVLATKENFYAEEGFSDIDTKDILAMTSKISMDPDTSKRALRSLINKGLLSTETYEHREQNDKGRWSDVKYTIVYLDNQLWHMIGWDKDCYMQQDEESVTVTDSGKPMSAAKKNDPTGPQAQLTKYEYNVNNAADYSSAYKNALNHTDPKNAKTAIMKFIKSDRKSCRYYGVTLTK